jgi:hypothetical protein
MRGEKEKGVKPQLGSFFRPRRTAGLRSIRHFKRSEHLLGNQSMVDS